MSIDDVARAADVSRQTVFNYFPSKERILFDRDAEVEAARLAAVRDRPQGASLVSVFRAHTRGFWTRLDVTLGAGPLPAGFWGVNAAILTCGLHRLTRGDDPRGTVADMLAQADLAYDQFERGLGGDSG